jgi:hypothetical protein
MIISYQRSHISNLRHLEGYLPYLLNHVASRLDRLHYAVRGNLTHQPYVTYHRYYDQEVKHSPLDDALGLLNLLRKSLARQHLFLGVERRMLERCHV